MSARRDGRLTGYFKGPVLAAGKTPVQYAIGWRRAAETQAPALETDAGKLTPFSNPRGRGARRLHRIGLDHPGVQRSADQQRHGRDF